ncbi:chymotrypsin-2-like [Cylas formicarius]|uniref:chymotrypsin-2-like n=1 Tax=Cylas formicarius TaxID=197179 RepID=UPI0029583E8F|nr:chymotrypsin-2-like [Cylas formicarius]
MSVKTLLAFAVSAIVLLEAKSANLRITGGEDASLGQFPYEVAIIIEDLTGACAGSLISEEYVLTVADCLELDGDWIVVLGAKDISVVEPGQIRQKISKENYIIHENFTSFEEHNIALIKLPQPVQYNDLIQPIKLTDSQRDLAGEVGVVAGWGTSYGAQIIASPVLQWTNNTFLTYEQCIYDHPIFTEALRDEHVCLAPDYYKAPCVGDAGSPIVVNGEQVALVSYGYFNCFLFKPNVNTRISAYRDWIKEKTGI